MEKLQFHIHYPFWYVLICLLIGGAYAYLLYRGKRVWSKTYASVLGVVRGVLVAALVFLLLEPVLNKVINIIEKPIMVIAVDNSESMLHVNPNVQAEVSETVSLLSKTLEDKGFEVKLRSLDADSSNILKFTAQQTNIDQLLDGVENEFEGLNFGGMYLLSDGIANAGLAPQYQSYNVPVHTIAFGDAEIHNDIALNVLYYNKIALYKNKFPLVAEISHKGFANKEIKVRISRKGVLLEEKKVTLGKDQDDTRVSFELDADQEGILHYTVDVIPEKGEYTNLNNSKNAYVEVINERQKIVLYASSPHPDIKMIKSVLDKQDKYELIVHVLSTDKNIPTYEKTDLVIFHQIPNLKRVGNKLLQHYNNKAINRLFVLGSNTDLKLFSETNKCLKIKKQLNRSDEVTMAMNEAFDHFNYDKDKFDIFDNAPPLNVPFGEYTLKGDAEVMTYQQVGGVQTEKALSAFRSLDGNKEAVITSSDLWRWRLFEFMESEHTTLMDGWLGKTIQLLATGNDKRKLRVRTTEEEFSEAQKPGFTIETYNELYEKVYDQNVKLKIKDKDGKTSEYDFVTSQGRLAYYTNRLKEGVYNFEASSTLNNDKHIVKGAIVINHQKLEIVDLTAKHEHLQLLSKKSGAYAYNKDDHKKILADIAKLNPKEIIHSEEEEESIFRYHWLLYLFILLAFVEWFTRKRLGGY